MKVVYFILLFLFTIIACNPENEIPDICDYINDRNIPSCLDVEPISMLNYSGSIRDIYFVNDNVGYLLTSKQSGGIAEIFKTTNRGENWTNLHADFRSSGNYVYFINEEIGFVSTFSGVFKTVDGGDNWLIQEFNNIEGNLRQIRNDDVGNLYSIMSGLDVNSKLLKSEDNGESWRVINDRDKIGGSNINFSILIYGNKIYTPISGDQFLITDLEGNELKLIEFNEPGSIQSVEVINENTFFVSFIGQLLRTIDGGSSFEIIHNRRNNLISFVNENTGFAILNKSDCPTDVVQGNEVFACTLDGGDSWIESEISTNLLLDFKGTSTTIEGNPLFILGQSIYKITE